MKDIVSEVLQGSPLSLAVPSVFVSDLYNGEDTDENPYQYTAIQTIIQNDLDRMEVWSEKWEYYLTENDYIYVGIIKYVNIGWEENYLGIQRRVKRL